MQINISRRKILINVVPKLHANKKNLTWADVTIAGALLKMNLI
jgi:hypothetical protein